MGRSLSTLARLLIFWLLLYQVWTAVQLDRGPETFAATSKDD